MSMDNGHIIRKDPSDNKFVLQGYSASADEMPSVSSGRLRFDTLEEAVLEYNEGSRKVQEQTGFPIDEYGLSIQV